MACSVDFEADLHIDCSSRSADGHLFGWGDTGERIVCTWVGGIDVCDRRITRDSSGVSMLIVDDRKTERIGGWLCALSGR